jgi:hypothetical protein
MSRQEQADPYRYGWRYVRQIAPDGAETSEQVPLRHEDVLHPEEGDFIVNSPAHNDNRGYLYNALRGHLAEIEGVVVLHQARIDWGVPGVRPHGADVALFLGVRRPWNRHRATFMVAEVDALPALVIEVTSPTTRAFDLDEKVLEYHRAGVAFYAIVDDCPELDPPRVRVLAYRTTPEGYVRVPPDERGWVWLEPAQLWLVGEGWRVRCYDKWGQRIRDYVEMSQGLQEANCRIQQAAELRRLRGQ